MNQEFPAGSRWRRRDRKRVTVILYGEAGGIVTFRGAEDDQPMTERAHAFRSRFERIAHPEEPWCERCKKERVRQSGMLCSDCTEALDAIERATRGE